MSIIEYFVRCHLKRQLYSAIERIAELDELILVWKDKKCADNADNVPVYVVRDLGNWRAERAKLYVRKQRIEKELGLDKKSP